MRNYTPRPRCGANKTDGTLCRNGAGARTDHPGVGFCANHCGATPTHQVYAERIEAERVVARFGLELDGTPAPEILIREIGRASAMVQFVAAQVAELPAQDLVWGTTKRKVRQDAEGAQTIEAEQKAVQNIWVIMLREERQQLRELIVAAHRCNIEERMIRQAELEGALMVKLLNAVLAEFRTRWELTREQVEWAGTVVAKHLRLLEAE